MFLRCKGQIVEQANREEKLVEKEAKGSSRTNVEDKRSPEDVLKEMQMQKTHDLYCPNCTHNITRTAELFEKGKEKFQYNNENIILSFVIVVSFKYPFIFLPWFYNNTPDEPAPSVVSETPKKHVPAWLRFVLVVVLLLLSALVLLWIPPSPSPLSPKPIPPPTPHTNGNDKPIWPSPSTIVNKGGLVHFYWVKYLPSSRVLYVISLLLLAALALFWPSMTRTKGTEPEGKADLPNEKEVLGDKEGVPSLIGGLSTPGNKTNGSERAKEIPPPLMAPQPTTFAKILSILRQHIVVPVHNVLQTELDILKSIVYGGLIESITSFGVVSSAAASGTSTLNVMALGLANLLSGLFLIIYNLYGLVMSEPFFPHAHIDNATDMKDKIDPYEQMLGNRNNVALHCIVVVVSFIFFGVIPPLFYGFSFKTTDNRYYEAAVFVAASLLCVITLSFGKAHAFKKDKLKTVAVYTGIAIGASAFSCIASQHVRGLLEKYEFHKIASD
uniref:Membrane protein of ER body-like protein n=1 Tax=Brassica oleracea var. oleracea TaxID=109376 RepID=A0A0D3DN69_BRAOL